MQTITVPPPPGPPTGIAAGIFELLLIVVIITLIVYYLHRNDSSRLDDTQAAMTGISTRTITAALLVTALFAPASFNIYFGGFDGIFVYLFAMTWQIINFPSLDVTLFGPFELMMTTLLMFVRLLFVYQVYRYYRGRSGRIRTIIVGIAGELQLTIITAVIILYLLTTPIIDFIVMIALPFPILLVLGLWFMYAIPVPDSFTPWKEIEEPKPWWDGESEDSSVIVTDET